LPRNILQFSKILVIAPLKTGKSFVLFNAFQSKLIEGKAKVWSS